MPKGRDEVGGGRGRGPWEGRRRLCKDNTAHHPVPAWDTATRKAQIRVSWGPPAAAQFQLCSAELTRLRKPLLQTPSLLDQGTKRGELPRASGITDPPASIFSIPWEGAFPRGDPGGPQPMLTSHTPNNLFQRLLSTGSRTLSGLVSETGEISSVQPKGQSL